MKKRIVLILLVCALTVAEARVWVVAHRGAKNEAPENTIPAYARAVELGADYIEVDVRGAAGGALVLMHDHDVARTTNGTGAVASMTLAQILGLDAGIKSSPRFAGTRVPTFAEALAQFAQLLPGVATMPTVRSVGEVAEVCRRLKTTVVRLSLAQLDDAALVDAVHRAGAQVSITILGRADNEETMRRTIRLGADIIETDSPGLLVRVRESLPDRKK